MLVAAIVSYNFSVTYNILFLIVFRYRCCLALSASVSPYPVIGNCVLIRVLSW